MRLIRLSRRRAVRVRLTIGLVARAAGSLIAARVSIRHAGWIDQAPAILIEAASFCSAQSPVHRARGMSLREKARSCACSLGR
jgi:hypothetical protein